MNKVYGLERKPPPPLLENKEGSWIVVAEKILLKYWVKSTEQHRYQKLITNHKLSAVRGPASEDLEVKTNNFC